LRLLEFSENPSEDGFRVDDETLKKLYKYAIKNRMPSPFLQKMRDVEATPFLDLTKRDEENYSTMLSATSRVSKILLDGNVKHATFKTIRPYRSTTVDIDVIIFGQHGDYLHALETMKSSHYSMLFRGPQSSTFWDSAANIGIDLYDEVAVSNVCYLDKNTLDNFTRNMTLPNGQDVMILTPEADMLAIAAHSIIKEQMYTLSEYLSFMKYLDRIDVGTFVELAKRTHLTSAARTHASITAVIAKAVLKTTPMKLHSILVSLGFSSFEMNRISRLEFACPHKYHLMTLGKTLIEIMRGKKQRSSFALQVYSMTNPVFASRFFDELLGHVKRATY
jgi:hypothetical protein